MKHRINLILTWGMTFAVLGLAHPALAQHEPSPQERCLLENDLYPGDDEVKQRWNARITERPIGVFAGHAGFMMGGGLNGAFSGDPDDSLDYSWTLAGRGEVMLLSPLWISARARYFGGEGANIHLDALAGFNIRRYRNIWIKAGRQVVTTSNLAITSAWNSHCQLRRSDFQFLGGAKVIAATGDGDSILGLQAGIQSMRDNGKIGTWSLTGIYDPSHVAYGGQLTMGVGGIYGLPGWMYTDFTTGLIVGGTSAFWMTIDFGVVFEL